MAVRDASSPSHEARLPGQAGIPEQLGRYTILGKLASGGMATVYVGRQAGAAGFERLVAIKCCHDHLRHNEGFASLFLQEARLAARIRHPNVVATIDVGEVSSDEPLYIVMEYVEGDSLSALTRRATMRGQRLPVEIAMRIMLDALSGLHAAHESCGPDGKPLGVVHCDVSPQNILVGVDGTTRITDFGIARAAAHVSEDDHGVIKGKLSYMAPEQLNAERITRTVDVFAAGVVLWEMLTGKTLFSGDGDADTARAVLLQKIARPSSVQPSVPPALDAVVLRALERKPAARYASAADFLMALEKLPIRCATAREAGEYVRGELGAGVLASRWESGSFRRPVVAARSEDDVTGSLPSHEHEARTRVVEPTGDMLTRVAAPTEDLLAAVQSEEAIAAPEAVPPAHREPMAGEAHRMRRVVVAIVLVLLGCAGGLLFSSSPPPPQGTPAPAAVPQK